MKPKPIKEKIEDWDMNYLTNGIVADYFYQNEARLGETLEENHSLKLKNYRIIKERIVALFSKVIEEIIKEVKEMKVVEDEFLAISELGEQHNKTIKEVVKKLRARLKDILKGENGK
jgi:hypothetical protein